MSASAWAFSLEAGDELFGVHPQLDDLERNLTPHRFRLLGQVDYAETAFA